MDSTYRILISIVSWNYLENVVPMVNELLTELYVTDYIAIIETGKARNPKLASLASSHSNICFISTETNDGYAAAHAVSVEMMQKLQLDGVLLLNPDIKLFPNQIKRLKTRIAQSRNNLVIGAPVFNLHQGQLVLEYGGFPLSPESKQILHAYTWHENQIWAPEYTSYPVTDLHGCFIYFPAQVIQQHGWMDTRYFLYGEENEYLHRLNQKNVALLVDTELAVLHENGGTFNQPNPTLLMIREYYRTRNRLYNNFLFGGIRALFRLNFKFILTYSIGRYILRLHAFQQKDMNYYNFIAHIHFMAGIRGKYFAPEHFTS